MIPGNAIYQLFKTNYRRLDPGNAKTIITNRQFSFIPMVSTAAETRTLARPGKAGLYTVLTLKTDGGDVTVTVTGGYNADADASLIFADAGDYVKFYSIEHGGSFYWRVVAFEGVDVAGEDMTPGTGISTGVDTVCEHRVSKIGGLYKTEIFIDLAGLTSAAAGQIIGKASGVANCHIGQITAAKNGTIIHGRITCIETPAGGDTDVDFYGTVTEATGAQAAAISGLTGEVLLLNNGAWSGAVATPKIMTTLPGVGYLYMVDGTGTAVIYTAGLFLIELWGK